MTADEPVQVGTRVNTKLWKTVLAIKAKKGITLKAIISQALELWIKENK